LSHKTGGERERGPQQAGGGKGVVFADKKKGGGGGGRVARIRKLVSVTETVLLFELTTIHTQNALVTREAT